MCSCLPNYIGSPPGCRPECVVSSECSFDKACVNQKCVNPCTTGTCGTNAVCRVNNHSPICSCNNGFTGNPFVICNRIPRKTAKSKYSFAGPLKTIFCVVAPPQDTPQPENRDPCYPSPCGANAQCRNVNGVPSCSCLPTYIGAPPSCRPECTINSECRSNQACIREKCQDPCPGLCGISAQCSVINHIPICTCLDGYEGDAFTSCNRIPPRKWSFSETHFISHENIPLEQEPIADDPCNPNPCGSNAVCNNGICTCLAEYQGDPYTGCRPECVLNSDCPRDKACLRSKCVDPCSLEACAQTAICEVISHIPMCRCPPGFEGNALVQCQPVKSMHILNMLISLSLVYICNP